MSNTERLFLIEKELKQYLPIVQEASTSILDNDISKYPIFVVHKEEIKVGINVIDKNKTTANWSIEASTLEEFVVKNLIHQSKVEEFRKTYKNPKDFVCFFLVSEMGAQFIFMAFN